MVHKSNSMTMGERFVLSRFSGSIHVWRTVLFLIMFSLFIPQSLGHQEAVAVAVEKTLSQLVLSKKHVTLQAGDSFSIVASAIYSDDSAETVTKQVDWSSSNPSVVAVQAGKLTAQGEGEATVQASFGGKQATVNVAVVKKLKALVLAKKSLNLKAGGSEQVALQAHYTDNSSADVTNLAEWSAKDYTIASVDRGIITAIRAGQTEITADFGTKTAKISVYVDAVEKLAANQPSVKLRTNGQSQILLTATYKDGSTADVTMEAEWKTEKKTIATVEKGLVTAVGPGKTTIQVLYNNKTLSIPVEVDVVNKLQVDKRKLQMRTGEKEQLEITAVFSDGSTDTVTSAAAWSVARKGVAEVANGVVTGISAGKTSVTAKAYGKSISVPVEVDIVKSLSVIEKRVVLNKGEKKQIAVTALYSDGSTEDVAAKAVWNSTNKDVAEVSSAEIYAKDAGRATLTASFGRKTVNISVHVQSTTTSALP